MRVVLWLLVLLIVLECVLSAWYIGAAYYSGDLRWWHVGLALFWLLSIYRLIRIRARYARKLGFDESSEVPHDDEG